MRILAVVVLVFALVLIVAVGWQQLRYLHVRRQIVQDRQPLLHSADCFHVLTLLVVPEGADVIEEVRKLRDDLEAGGEALMVWAGQAAFTALESAQIPKADWNAVVLVQYPSRARFDVIAASPGYRAALERFEHSYSHGLKRARGSNLGLPVWLLALRAGQILRGAPSHYPFVPVAAEDRDPATGEDARLDGLLALKSLSEDAVVIVNLLRRGTPEQVKADAGYVRQMAGLFAEGGHGPMHMGRAVTIEGNALFDHVALVYYPGIDYFREMANSTFFQGIVGGKQPGDTLAVPTVPILARL